MNEYILKLLKQGWKISFHRAWSWDSKLSVCVTAINSDNDRTVGCTTIIDNMDYNAMCIAVYRQCNNLPSELEATDV